jgi:large subunit ribosomal protein L5
MSLLREEYNKSIKAKLIKDLNCSSPMAVPALEKIVVNMGVGKFKDNKQYIAEAFQDIANITGQKPTERKSKVAISNFKLRRGQVVGVCVTLRGQKMWDFYEKLVKIVFPRVKDFRGISRKSFDGQGNYSLGMKDLLVFPEIDGNKASFNKPLQIIVKTSSKNDEEGYALLKVLGMPFKD